MARLYGNENLPLPVVEALRKLGHDIITIQETGRGGDAVPDPDVLRYAAEDQRAVVTLNRRDFIKLHRLSATHAGIIVCTFDPDFSGQAARIHAAITSSAVLTGRLIRVDRPNRVAS